MKRGVSPVSLMFEASSVLTKELSVVVAEKLIRDGDVSEQNEEEI
jgi:hypothetical protein